MDGSDDEMTEAAKRFSRRLHGRYGLPTELHDERLTTRAAWQIAEESEQRYSKQQIDSLSAVLITESWLASRTPNREAWQCPFPYKCDIKRSNHVRSNRESTFR